jgi:tetratricopeptide (TPR) repeat protein
MEALIADLKTIRADPAASLISVAPAGVSFAERTPFVGRAGESAELRRYLDRAKNGRGSLVMVGGEPGVGKTRLTAEFEAQARRHGLLTLTGGCYDQDTSPSYIPFIEIIESLIRSMEPEALLGTLGETAPEVARIVPELRRPEQERRHLLNNIRDFFERLAGRQPLLLVLEDLHWADDSTVLSLQHMAQRINELPVLVVGTYRDMELDTAPCLARAMEEMLRRRQAHDLILKRLSADDVAAMLSARSGQKPPARLADLIYRETDGNPFFVEEIFKFLAEEGRLFDSEGQWRAEVEIREEEVPRGVDMIISRRLKRVSDECRRVLTAAAVVGRRFSFVLLKTLMGIDEDTLLDAIEAAERAQLVSSTLEETEDQYMFFHELIRQTLLSRLSPARRRRLHVRVGEAIENLYADSLDQHMPALAHHFFQARNAADTGKTLHYLTLAGERALSASAFEDTVRLFDNALTLIPEGDKQTRADLLYKRGLALRSIGRREEATVNWREAQAIYEELGNEQAIGRICEVLSSTLFWEDANFPEAHKAVERGLSALGDRIDASRCHMLATAAILATAMPGNYQQSHDLFDQAISVANELGDERVLGPILHRKAQWHNIHWQAMEAVDAGRRGCELSCAARNLYEAADSLAAAEYGFTVLGRIDEAIEIRAEVESLAARSGNDIARWMSHGNSSIREFITGADLARIEDSMSAHLEFTRSTALPMMLAVDYTHLGTTQFLSGKWEEAQKNFREGADIAFLAAFYGLSLGALFRFLAYAGDKETALGMLPQMKDIMPQPGQPAYVGAWTTLKSTVEGLVMLGEWDEAAKLYPLTLEAISTGNLIYWSWDNLVQTIAGIAAMAGHQWDKAAEHYEIAVRQAHEMPFRIEQPEVRRWYARMLIERNAPGDKDKARTLLTEAIEMYRDIGMPKHLDMAEKLMNRI